MSVMQSSNCFILKLYCLGNSNSMISNFLEIFFLSAVQGITEFIPVSSSAHLILSAKWFDFSISSLIIDVGLHLGSLLAILFYFRKDSLLILKRMYSLGIKILNLYINIRSRYSVSAH